MGEKEPIQGSVPCVLNLVLPIWRKKFLKIHFGFLILLEKESKGSCRLREVKIWGYRELDEKYRERKRAEGSSLTLWAAQGSGGHSGD